MFSPFWIPNISVYLFKLPSSYLGKSTTTDTSGQVVFSLPERFHKFRADYLGYQFWSDIFTIPDTLSGIMSIPYQEIIITVENLYGTQKNRGNGIPYTSSSRPCL